MRYTIENEFLTVTADTAAGELRGIKSKKSGKEYLWTGDEKFWFNSAPMLFPIIGAVTDDTLRIDGKEYQITKHGFVRQSTFTLVKHTADTMVFELRESEATLKMYPYKFCLRFRYILRGTAVESIIEVVNTDDKKIYFAAGGHPALMCPFNKDETFEDYYLEFSEPETLDKVVLEGPYRKGTAPFLNNERRVHMQYGLFEHDALIVNRFKSDSICLRSSKSDNYVSFSLTGFPWLGIWSKHLPDTPFVCIEPWDGVPDAYDFKGEFKDKHGIISLDVHKTYSIGYTIEVHE